MIDYTIGDDILALFDHSTGVYKKGHVYKCESLILCPCGCKIPKVNIGKIPRTNYSTCYVTNKIYNNQYVYFVDALSFKKLDFDISELTEILETENKTKQLL